MTTPAPLTLLVIQTKKNGVFIKQHAPASYYGSNPFAGYLFDGTPAAPTPVNGWAKLAATPSAVTKEVQPPARTIGYELSKGFSPSERLPARIEGVSTLEDGPYEGVAECYTAIRETFPMTTVEVPFQVTVIAERDAFEIVKQEFTVEYGLIDQLVIADPVLLSERPCRLSAAQSYNLIRAHIKTNIDLKYAEVTSDYDFCLTVKKRVEMAEPEAYQVNVGTSRRPKTRTDYRRDRMVTCYEVSPSQRDGKPYQHYPIVQPFVGTSYEDLQAKIKAFLTALMRHINAPLCECKTCKGMGVVLKAVVLPPSS
jgi:hypothetical protein